MRAVAKLQEGQINVGASGISVLNYGLMSLWNLIGVKNFCQVHSRIWVISHYIVGFRG
jgi:hypothetical protein